MECDEKSEINTTENPFLLRCKWTVMHCCTGESAYEKQPRLDFEIVKIFMKSFLISVIFNNFEIQQGAKKSAYPKGYTDFFSEFNCLTKLSFRDQTAPSLDHTKRLEVPLLVVMRHLLLMRPIAWNSTRSLY